jgi:hydroxymethylpyrimidine pyrophosphatase-like HAD family hydrolase
MLSCSGISCAIENMPATKSDDFKPDFIIPSPDKDGLAKFLDEHLLN